MHHIAIMTPSWQLIPKILSGEKTIESRWYQTRRAPWNTIHVGDVIYFKNSGKSVTARATVSQVQQFEIQDIAEVKRIIAKYGDAICLINRNPKSWKSVPKYCILLTLSSPRAVKPFQINKRGFGAGAAWLSVSDIKTIMSPH